MSDDARRARQELNSTSNRLKGELRRLARDLSGQVDRKGRDVGRQSSAEGAARSQDIDKQISIAGLIGAVLVGVGALILAAGHVSALAFDTEVPRYRLAEAPAVVVRVLKNPGHPAAAWEPVNSGGRPPGALAFWATAVLLVGVTGSPAALVLSRRNAPAATRAPRGFWADRTELGHLRIEDPDEPRLVVGTSGRSKLAIGHLESLLVVGPAHAGKTSALGIPALLEWPGPAVVASTKGHLMDETIGWRRRRGEVHVFDPAGASRYEGSGWSLLFDCGTWQGAIRTAQHLTAAVNATLGNHGGRIAANIEQGPLWTSAMAMSLAPFLYAAATDGRSVMDAAEWLEREERDEPLEILRPIDPVAAHTHETTFHRQDASRSTFFHLIYQMLSVYGDPSVAATGAKHEIVPEELLDGGRHTLYLTAAEHDQVRFQPLFATIVRHMMTAATDRFASRGTPLDPPLLLLFDEAVGAASVEDLAAVAATGAAKGVQVVSIFEDLGKYDGIQQDAAGLLTKSHRAVLVLPGKRGFGEPGSGTSDRLTEIGTHLSDGQGALSYGSARPVRLRLRPWYSDPELRRRVAEAKRMDTAEHRPIRANRSPVRNSPDYSLVDQTMAWRRGWARSGRSDDETLVDGATSDRRWEPDIDHDDRSPGS